MSRIAVIGSPGGGKSYFSKRLSKATGIPLYHMDNIYWHADKTHITREELVRAVDEIMQRNEWIIDGNYISTMEQRVKGADLIFYLDLSTEQCLEGIRSRVGKPRSDMPWFEEEPDEDFIDFVIKFRDETKPLIEEILMRYKEKKVVRFTTREEMDTFLTSVHIKE